MKKNSDEEGESLHVYTVYIEGTIHIISNPIQPPPPAPPKIVPRVEIDIYYKHEYVLGLLCKLYKHRAVMCTALK